MPTVVQDQVASDFLAGFDRPIAVSAISKLRKWPFLQELGYNGQLKYLRENFHGLEDFRSQMNLYSSTHFILRAAWATIEEQVPINPHILRQLTLLPELGQVGRLFQQALNFAQVFAVSIAELQDPKSLSAKVGSFL